VEAGSLGNAGAAARPPERFKWGNCRGRGIGQCGGGGAYISQTHGREAPTSLSRGGPVPAASKAVDAGAAALGAAGDLDQRRGTEEVGVHRRTRSSRRAHTRQGRTIMGSAWLRRRKSASHSPSQRSNVAKPAPPFRFFTSATAGAS